MTKSLPKITYKVPEVGKRRCTVDFRLGELRCMKKGEGIHFVKFTDMPEGKYSKVKKKLRGLRARTYHNEYIQGIDD